MTEFFPCNLLPLIKDWRVRNRFIEFMCSNVTAVSNPLKHSYQIWTRRSHIGIMHQTGMSAIEEAENLLLRPKMFAFRPSEFVRMI